MTEKINKLVLVLAGGGYQWDRQEISCRETWANPTINPEDTKVYFIRGNAAACFYDKGVERNDNWQSHRFGKNLTDMMNSSVNINHDTRTIFVDVPDGHAYSMFKFALALKHIREHFEWNYLVRPNSGSYINLNVLDQKLRQLPTETLYFGYPCRHHGLLYASGSCFTVSSDISDLIISKTEQLIFDGISTILPDDALIGKILSEKTLHYADRIDITYDQMLKNDDWFDSNNYHYWFMSTKDERPHYLIHKKFYGLRSAK